MCLLITNDTQFVNVGMYVHDVIIISESKKAINNLIAQLQIEVKIKNSKERTKFLTIYNTEANKEFTWLKQANPIQK